MRQYPATLDEKLGKIIKDFSIAGLQVKKSSQRLPRGVINVSRFISVYKVM
jgi:hypothetical protein